VPNFEARYVTKQDEVRFALFNSAPLYDVKQNQTGIVLTGIDLTEHKFLERQVVHTEKLASLGEMAAGVAHELNNPLTSIYTNADLQVRLAQRDGRDEAEQRRLAAILEGAERIKTLVRNLMGYVRQSNEEWVPLDMNGLIEKALSFCNYELTRNGVVLRRELADGIPPVYGIPSQLQQVIVNLLTNASHAMAGRPGAVTLRSQQVEDKVILQVEDMGTGIRREELPKIFTPFYTTKPEGKGTGLGLSIVMRILENHGARVEVRSDYGVGSCFTIVLPAAQ
jgi:C4-dicarboxylate-specific signal transduction histidine kinase